MIEKDFYKKLVAPYQDEMLTRLKQFVAIDSTYDPESVDEKNPFGKGVSKALCFIEEMAKQDGFIVNNYDNKIVEILTNNLEKNITIMAHADIVPVGSGWPQDPLTMIEKDGVLYGRGVSDDKGPLLASYYGLKALRDNNLLGHYQVRFLVGGNEESGSLCMEHYFHHLHKKQPTLGFSPDSAYPLTYAEKGIIGFLVKKQIQFPNLLSIKGGVASNSVIEKCEVTLKSDLDFINYLSDQDVEFSYLANDDQMTLTFYGVAAHGSVPWMGKNAALVAIKYLGIYYKNDDFNLFYKLYSPTKGEGIKCSACSKNMGNNSLNVGLFSFENGILEASINFRYVETVKEEEMINNFVKYSAPFSVEVLGTMPLLFYPKDSLLVQTLLKVYQDETGDLITPIIASGGGTYAKEADNVVAFGMEFPGYDSKMHGVNENVEVKALVSSMAIYARAIIELGKKI